MNIIEHLTEFLRKRKRKISTTKNQGSSPHRFPAPAGRGEENVL